MANQQLFVIGKSHDDPQIVSTRLKTFNHQPQFTGVRSFAKKPSILIGPHVYFDGLKYHQSQIEKQKLL